MNLCEGRGCIKGIKAQAPYIYNGEKIWECPMTFYNEEVGQALVLYSAYKNGFLPDSGGFLDQSARFVDYMDLIGEEIKEQERRQMQRQKNKINSKRFANGK